jgi:hypothetical protein
LEETNHWRQAPVARKLPQLVVRKLQTASQSNPHMVSFEDYRPVFLGLYM